MSKEIDNRVVSMEFDNKKFEKNVKQSQQSIKELDKSLEMKDAAKGMQNVEKESGSLSDKLRALFGDFNALEQVAVGAFFTIGQKVAELGMKITDSLVIDPIRSGWQKYADETSSVQTIMSATGRSIDDVEKRLKQLTWFTDETSYAYTDMISNIGKFTSNEVGLDTAVSAMEGIANWAAVSGQNAQKASQAMYNLSQAIGVGSLQVMDWKSIENANMATAEFKNAAIEAAVELGTLREAADGTFTTVAKGTEVTAATFRSTLNEKWLTNDVLLATLNKYGAFTDQLYKYVEETGVSATDFLTYLEDYSKGALDLEQVAEDTEMSIEELVYILDDLGSEENAFGLKALKAAQEAKTFADAIDATKDAVSTGWKDTFKAIFGNYDEQRKTWTALASDLWEIFAGGAEYRNDFLSNTLDSNYANFEKLITRAGGDVDEFRQKVMDSASKLVDTDEARKALQEADTLIEGLKNAGLDASSIIYDTVSAMTTKTTGELRTLSREIRQGAYGETAAEIVQNLADANNDLKISEEAVEKALRGESIAIADLSEETMKALGYTEEEIDLFTGMSEEAEKANMSIEDMLYNIDAMSNRQKVMDGIGDILKNIGDVLGSFRKAFWNSFGKLLGDGLDSLIDKFYNFSERLRLTDEDCKTLENVFTGLFSIIDLFVTLIKSVASPIFEVLGALFGEVSDGAESASTGILSFINEISNGIQWVVAFIKEHNILYTVLHSVANILVTVIQTVKKFFRQLFQAPAVSKLITKVGDALEWFFTNFGDIFQAGIETVTNFISSLVGLNEFSMDGIITTIDSFVSKFASIDSISSFIKTLSYNLKPEVKDINGLMDSLKDGFTTTGKKIREFFTDTLNLNFGNVLAIGTGIGLIAIITKLSNFTAVIDGFLSSIQGFATAFKKIATSISDTITSLGKAAKNRIKAETFFKTAEGIALMAAAVTLLAGIDQKQLWSATGVIATLTAIISGAIILVSRVAKAPKVDRKSISTFTRLGLGILELAGAILLITWAFKSIAEMESDQYFIGAAGVIIGLMFALGTVVAAITKYGKMDRDFTKAASMFLMLGLSVWILAHAFDTIIDAMYEAEIKGQSMTNAVYIVGAILLTLAIASAIAGKSSKTTAITILSFAIGIKMLISSIQDLADMDDAVFKNGLEKLSGLLAIIAIFIAAILQANDMFGGLSKAADIGKKAAEKSKDKLLGIGVAMAGIGIAVWLLVKSIESFQNISWGTMLEGVIGVGALLIGLAGVLYAVSKVDGKNDLLKASAFAIAVGVTVAILAGVAVLLGLFDLGVITQGIIAVDFLLAGLALVFKGASGLQESAKSVMAIAITVAALGIMLAVLSGVEWQKLASATIAIVSVLLALSVVFYSVRKASDAAKGTTKSTIITMATIVGALILLIAAIAAINRWIGPINLGIETAGSMALLIVAMIPMFYMLSQLGNLTIDQKNILALVEVFGILALLMAAIAAINAYIGPINLGIETAASMALLCLAMVPMTKALTKMAQACQLVPWSIFGGLLKGFLLVEAAIVGILAVIATIVYGLGLIGAGFNEWPELAEGFQTSLQMFKDIMTVVADVIQSIIEKIANGIANGIRSICVGINDSIILLNTTFSVVSDNTINKIKVFAEAIAIMAEGSFLNSMSSIMSFGSTKKLPEQVKSIGTAIKDFEAETKSISDSGRIKEIAQAAYYLFAGLAECPTTGGALEWLTGKQDLGQFATNIESLGAALQKFQDSTAEINQETISGQVAALDQFVRIGKDVSWEGGFLAALTGDQGLGGLAGNIRQLGLALAIFQGVTPGVSLESLQGPFDALERFCSLAEQINDAGAKYEQFSNYALGSLADQIGLLASALWGFATATGENSEIDRHKVDDLLYIAQRFTQMATSLNEGNGIGFEKIASNIEELADGLDSAIKTLSEIDPNKITTAISAAAAVKDLVGIGEVFNAESGKNLNSSNIDVITTGLKKIPAMLEALTAIDTSDDRYVNKASAVKSMIDNIINIFANIDTSEASKATEKAKTEGTADGKAIAEGYVEGVNAGVSANQPTFNFPNLLSKASGFFSGGGEAITGMANTGKNIVGSFADSVGSSESLGKVKTAATNLYQNGLDGGESLLPEWKTLGDNSALGFIQGLKDGEGPVWQAAFNFTQKAKQGAAAGVDSNSPSKEFFKIGSYCDDGMILGIESSLGAVAKAGMTMGTTVTNSVCKTLDINSPSRVLDRLGVYCGEGFANGLVKSSEEAIGKGSAYDKLLDGVVAKGYKTGKAWVDEQKKFDDLTTQQEFIFWKKMLETGNLGAEDKLAAEEAMYTAGKKLADEYYDGIFDYISQEEGYDRMNAHQKLAYLKQFESAFAEGTEAAKKYNKEVYDATKEDQAAYFEEFQNEIDDKQRYEGLTLEDELALWQGYYKRLEEAGLQWTDEYKQVGEKIKSINKDLADNSYQKNKETLDNMVDWGFATELDRYKQWQKEYNEIISTPDWQHNQDLVDRMDELVPKMRDYEEGESKHIENMYTEGKLTAEQYENMMRAWAAKMGYVEGSEKMLEIEKKIKDAYDDEYGRELDLLVAQGKMTQSTADRLKLEKRVSEGLSKNSIEYKEAAQSLLDTTNEENDALMEMSDHFGTIGIKAKKTAAIAKFVAAQYTKGTADWVSGMEEIYDFIKADNDAQKEFIEGYDDAYKEYNDNRKDLEDDYANKVKDINDQLKEDIRSLEDEYDDAVKSRADSLYSAVGLFDEVTKKEKVTAKTLRKNLTDQINEFKDWDATMDSLASRGLDQKLIEELQEMGVDAISEVKAMNSMTDDELKEYVALWNEKHSLTTARAGDELADMRKKVNTEIAGLRQDAYAEIAEYRTQFNKDLDDLNDTLTKAVETLLKAYNTSMYGENALASQLGGNVLDSAKTTYDQAKTESEKTGNVLNAIAQNSGATIAGSVDEAGDTIIGYLSNDVAHIADVIQLYDWNTVGKTATDGMSKGITDNAKDVWDALKSLVDSTITETYKALSAGPGQGSIKFMDIGWSIDKGIVEGVTAGGGFVMNAIHTMTDSIVGAFEGMMLQIESVINGGSSVSDIRPVFDMTSGYNNDLFLSAKAAATGAYLNSESAIDIIADKLQNGVDTAATKVVTAIGELKSEVSTLKNDIQQMKVVLDSGQLVGGIKNQMDNALGTNVVMQGRGVTKYSMG